MGGRHRIVARLGRCCLELPPCDWPLSQQLLLLPAGIVGLLMHLATMLRGRLLRGDELRLLFGRDLLHRLKLPLSLLHHPHHQYCGWGRAPELSPEG